MNNKFYILYNDKEYEILSVKKDFYKNSKKHAGKVWMFKTEVKEFTIADIGKNILFVCKCVECGKKSMPMKNFKIVLKDKDYLCKYCCKKGERNPFYGKTHTKETIDAMKIKNSAITKKLWENDEYRKKVIKGSSKPRREEFKEEQSIRIKQWYKDNPEQKEIRMNHMKKSWADGKITPNVNSINRSKGEKDLFNFLSEQLKEYTVEEKKTIKINGKWFLPDIVINDKIIVEYYGNYWHGNPKIYNKDDIVSYEKKAQDVWIHDKERKDNLELNGYFVLEVWETDLWKDDNLVNEIKDLLK